MLLKIRILAAKSPFATFKIFTAESLDLLLPLLGENAEATDAEILLRSFFPCPAWGGGVWRSVPRARDADRPVLILLLLTQDHGLEDAGFWSPGTGGSQPEQSKLIVDLSS